jgi:hypothetical protein
MLVVMMSACLAHREVNLWCLSHSSYQHAQPDVRTEARDNASNFEKLRRARTSETRVVKAADLRCFRFKIFKSQCFGVQLISRTKLALSDSNGPASETRTTRRA